MVFVMDYITKSILVNINDSEFEILIAIFIAILIILSIIILSIIKKIKD